MKTTYVPIVDIIRLCN